ncbi:MAG: Lipid II:glycine glycyltransferase [Syntrophorhabdaceae bacterium PtaU1.Bin034]|nr:MAG: Lipid II:glycine glycyltransferase [Syntrophorhabdaceae bacterium PtaU1.Bin034]
MLMKLRPKEPSALLPTDILFQTVFWSRVKSELGWNAHAFDLASQGCAGDLLVLTRSLCDGVTAAYVPQGPEYTPHPEHYGVFLEELSRLMAGYLDPPVSFIRYDLPWESQYSGGACIDPRGGSWEGRPEARLRELRMNFGTSRWNLRKAPLDLTVADTLMVDLRGSEEEILAAMKSKTRYNVRLAERKGVRVFPASYDMLPVFYDLYRQTAERNRFPACDLRHFSALFAPLAQRIDSTEIHFLLAVHDKDLLAGAIIAISGKTATYLFGASSSRNRNLMGPYALQWNAMRLARTKGCSTYEMGAVPPTADRTHPFYGMYRFKAGFGGKIVHRSGSWDYPLDEAGYTKFRNAEMLGSSLPWPKEE